MNELHFDADSITRINLNKMRDAEYKWEDEIKEVSHRNFLGVKKVDTWSREAGWSNSTHGRRPTAQLVADDSIMFRPSTVGVGTSIDAAKYSDKAGVWVYKPSLYIQTEKCGSQMAYFDTDEEAEQKLEYLKEKSKVNFAVVNAPVGYQHNGTW